MCVYVCMYDSMNASNFATYANFKLKILECRNGMIRNNFKKATANF